MIKDVRFFEKWEQEYRRNTPIDFFQNMRIYEALYEEACYFGILPLKDPLEGLETKINMARLLNVYENP
ncbi:hypothetical protein ACFL30_03195 [Candidatus Latescibacterota bacterium]